MTRYSLLGRKVSVRRIGLWVPSEVSSNPFLSESRVGHGSRVVHRSGVGVWLWSGLVLECPQSTFGVQLLIGWQGFEFYLVADYVGRYPDFSRGVADINVEREVTPASATR